MRQLHSRVASIDRTDEATRAACGVRSQHPAERRNRNPAQHRAVPRGAARRPWAESPRKTGATCCCTDTLCAQLRIHAWSVSPSAAGRRPARAREAGRVARGSWQGWSSFSLQCRQCGSALQAGGTNSRGAGEDGPGTDRCDPTLDNTPRAVVKHKHDPVIPGVRMNQNGAPIYDRAHSDEHATFGLRVSVRDERNGCSAAREWVGRVRAAVAVERLRCTEGEEGLGRLTHATPKPTTARQVRIHARNVRSAACDERAAGGARGRRSVGCHELPARQLEG